MALAAEEYWNHRAESYARQRQISNVDRDVVRLSEIADNMRILEVGCGPGVFAEYLLSNVKLLGLLYVGIDLSTSFAEYSRHRLATLRGAQAEILRASVNDMPFPRSAFDLVYAMAVLHHLALQDIVKALDAIRHCLKPTGQLLIAEDWAFEPRTEFERIAVELRKRLMEHENVVENHLSSAQWRALIEEAGFGIKGLYWSLRPFHWERCQALTDEDSRNLVLIVRNTPIEERNVRMVIFTISGRSE